jgi:hypothetical protein
MLKTANRADEQISEPPGTNAMFTLHHRDRMGCGGACLLRLRAKERPDILLKYSLSKYSLNLALLGYAAQATSSAVLPQNGLMAVRTRSSLERWETLVPSASS